MAGACGSQPEAKRTPIQWKAPATISVTSSPPESPTSNPATATKSATAIVIVGWPAQLGPADIEHAFDLAEVPEEYRAALSAIIECESHWSPGAIGDSGNSLGLAQLWTGWAAPDEDLMDVVTNLRVAVRVRQTRGRWGGLGGWSCAGVVGLD